jgi:acetyl/propionyl-CoA carboxylase alpha subunit
VLTRLLTHPRFVAGDLDTHFLVTEAASLLPEPAEPSAEVLAVAEALGRTPAAAPGTAAAGDPWSSLKRARV